VTTLADSLPWLLAGLATCLVHYLLLWLALARVRELSPGQAGRRMRRGLPLRLLVLAPILLVVARSGLVACAGWVVGSLLGRWLATWRHWRREDWPVAATGRRG